MALPFSFGDKAEASSRKLWVFGYGSLIWNPGFNFTDSIVGYVRGYSRRFWQGNTVQRGTPSKPGRVVTLVEESECLTWGVAFELADDDVSAAFRYLNNREMELGGYTSTIVSFQPKGNCRESFPVLLYVATANCKGYLGPAPMTQLANEIVSARGTCGHNVEYLVRLADFMRERLPEVHDEHLYLLEEYVRMKIKEANLCFATLMGPRYTDPGWRSLGGPPTVARPPGADGVEDEQEAAGGAEGEQEGDELRPRDGPNTFLYASRVPSTKLRCLNV